MLSPGDMFRSYGMIRVLVVEADEGRKISRPQCMADRFYVSISLTDDEESKTLVRFSTACYMFTPSRNSSSVNEEFLFDGVASTQSLVVSLNISSDSEVLSCQQTIIPVSRLEEDVEISQWYQMYFSSPNANSSSGKREEVETRTPGGAIKLQITVMRLEVPYSPVTPNPVPELKIEASRESQFNGPDSVDSSFAGIPITLVLPSSQNFPGIDDEGQQENTFESVSASEKVLVSILKSSSKGNQIGGMYREEADANVQDSGLLLSEEEDRHQDERVDLGVRKQSSLSCSFSLQSEAADGEGKSTETEIKVESGRKHRWPVEGDERLTVGLIDYALLIGPAELGFNNNPLSTANMSFSLKRDAKRVQVQYSLHPDSENGFTAHNTFGAQFRDLNAPQSPLSLTTSKSSGSGGSTMESDMCIWDRFPLEDHDESPLPAKIEYFACPDGSKTLTAATRPGPRFSSFVLSGAGESDGQYGVCLTAFIKSHNHEMSNIDVLGSHSNGSKSNRNCKTISRGDSGKSMTADTGEWWNQSEPYGDGENHEENASVVEGIGNCTWTAVTLSLLTRWPHVQQLQRCLLYLYRCSILQSLELWEERSEMLLAEHRTSLRLPSKSDDLDDDGDYTSYLVLEPLQLSYHCVELLTMLCLESPVPVWGVFTLDIVLAEQPPTGLISPSHDISNKLSPSKKLSNERGFPGENFDTVVNFAQLPSEDLPICAYSLSCSLFRCLGSRGVLTVLSAALAESRILFFSSDASLLPAVCESLRILLYPLKWAHVYLPVVPAPLLDLVQAPVPFILGTLTKWMDLIPSECLSDVVLVDLDTGAIDIMHTGTDEAIVPFPPKIETWLLCALQDIMITNAALIDSSVSVSPSKSSSDFKTKLNQIVEIDTAIQLIVFDVMANLLRYVPGCIFSLNVGVYEGPSHHVFNRPLFISECVDEETCPFLLQLTDTNAFEQFTESLYSPSMGYFLKALTALPPPTKKSRSKGLSNVRRQGRRGVSHIGRDVFPLVFEENDPKEIGNVVCHSIPDPVIKGGDRLNLIKLPTVSVTAESIIVTAPSSPAPIPDSSETRSNSGSMRGMLVFPVASQQVNRPFSIDVADCNSPFSTYSNSPKGATSTVAFTSVMATMFPDWICASAAALDEEEDMIQHCIGTITLRVINTYVPLLVCERGRQRHVDQHPIVGTLDYASYEGYQQGNIVSNRSQLSNIESFPVLSLALFSSQSRAQSTDLTSYKGCGTFSSDSQDFKSGVKLPTKSPRLRALRNVSQLEKDLQVAEEILSTSAITMMKEKRNSLPMRPLSSKDTSLAASAKRRRTGSIIITSSSRASTCGSIKSSSPSYMAFLPLIGKASALVSLSENELLMSSKADSESSSTPDSPSKSHAAIRPSTATSVGPGGWPASLSPIPDTLPATAPILLRSHSYGRMRSSTFSMMPTSSNSDVNKQKPARRRHSAESVGVTLALTSAPFPCSKKRLNLQMLAAAKLLEQQENAYADQVQIQDQQSSLLIESNKSTELSALSRSSSLSHHVSIDIPPALELELTPSSCQLCPPLKFDTDAFERSAGRIDEWTAGELAIALKKPLKPLLKMLKREVEAGTDPYSPWASSSPAHPLESTRSPFNVRSPIRRGSHRVAVGIGGAVSDYLQFAFSGVSMSPRQVDHLERRCATALADHSNRMRLVQLLRQTNKTVSSASSLPRSAAAMHGTALPDSHFSPPPPPPPEQRLESQLFPLHTSTFELLSRLYSLAVDACVCDRDYLAAYGLLGVGGLYYQIQQKEAQRPLSFGDRSLHPEREISPVIDGTEETEFLSERVCQHPIFQNPQLWLSVLKDRLSTSTSPRTPSDNRRTYYSPEKMKETGTNLKEFDALFSEAYALLFIINRLGVNFERAAAFNKMVSSEYGLAKGQYRQIQQYTDKLYSRSHAPSDDPSLFSPPRLRNDQTSSWDPSPLKEDGMSVGSSPYPLSNREKRLSFRSASSVRRGSDTKENQNQNQNHNQMLPGYTPLGLYRQRANDKTSTSFADLTLLLPILLAPYQEESNHGPTSVSIPLKSATRKPSFSPLSLMAMTRSPPFQSPLPNSVGSKGFGYVAHTDRIPINAGPGTWIGRRSSWKSGTERDSSSLEGSKTVPRSSLIARKFKSYFGKRVVKKEYSDNNTEVESMQHHSVHSTTSIATIAKIDCKMNPSLSSLKQWSPMSNEKDQRLGEVDINGESKKDMTQYCPVNLEGCPSDRANSIGTLGRYLIAGLGDGSISINDLMTGELVNKVRHSSSNEVEMNQQDLELYGGVTHLKCLPMLPLIVSDSNILSGVRDNVLHSSKSHSAFVSACSFGIVKIWSIVSSDKREESGVEGTKDRGGMSLIISTQATIKIHEGKSITCLQAEFNSGNEESNDKDDTDHLGWLVASGDKKGHVVITRSAISLQSWYLKQKDLSRSEGLGLGVGSGKHLSKKSRDRRSRSNSRELQQQQQLFTSISITALIGAGSVTCLTFTKKKSQSYALIGFASNMRDSACWEHLVIGTSLGRMAVVDILSAQCKYLLRGHSGAITSIVTPFCLPFVSTGCTDTLLASCGLDRRVILWTVPTSDRKPVSLSLNNAPTEDTSSPVVLEGQMLLNANSKYQSNSAADIHRSADGPLTALVISPISACMTGYGCSLFVAAAAADGMVILWDLLLIRRGSGGGAYNRRSFIGSQAVEAGVPVVLIGHTDRVTHMSYKSSGAIETASLDGTVRIWIRRAVETEASMPPLIRSKSYTPSPGFGAGRGSARGLGKMDSENDIFSTMSPKRGLNSEKSEGVADRSVFTCRAVLKVFDSNGDDTCGIDLCTISTYVPDPCHYAMKIAGSSKSTPCKSTPESVRYASKTGSISKLMNDKLEKDAKVEEVLSASLSHSQDQITNLEGAAAVGGVSDTKSWLIAVSLGGTIRAYTTPTFAPLQLSDTQTF